ncbi:MAG: hypothetical protein KTR32_29810 [Granulosicoccus sp.]|nr:hypothetical protein [Granulosicoccus sp.]
MRGAVLPGSSTSISDEHGTTFDAEQSRYTKDHLLLMLLLLSVFIGVILGYFLTHKKNTFVKLQAELAIARENNSILDSYEDSFALLFPSADRKHWTTLDIPLVDWQDRISVWLSSISGMQSVHRWGESVVLPVPDHVSLELTYYPLWVDINVRHEGELLQILESAWEINPAGIENRGCQVARAVDVVGLTARCLFALSVFSYPENDSVPEEKTR